MQKLNDLVAQDSKKISAEQGHYLLLLMEQITGATKHQRRIFAWNTEESPLAKLKNYCAYFSQNSTVPKKIRLSLCSSTNKLWLHGLEVLDYLQECPYPLKGERVTQIQKAFTKMVVQAAHIGATALQIVTYFPKDENLLYFIVRHSSTFDALLGEKITVTTIEKMYNSLKEGEKYLIKRYKKRAFSFIIDNIQEQFTTLCH